MAIKYYNTVSLLVIKQHKTKIQQTHLSGTLTTITTFVRRWDVVLGKTSALINVPHHTCILCVCILYIDCTLIYLDELLCCSDLCTQSITEWVIAKLIFMISQHILYLYMFSYIHYLLGWVSLATTYLYLMNLFYLSVYCWLISELLFWNSSLLAPFL